MRLSTKLSGIVALGGAAALAAGLITSGGIGAAFTSGVTATANLNVGTIACTISAPGDTDSDPSTVTIDLGQIKKSDPGQKTVKATVSNTGDIPAYVNWSTTTSGAFFANWWGHEALSVTQNLSLAGGASRAYTIGAEWDELTNRDMGTTGTVVYSAICSDQAAKYWLSAAAGGTSTQVGDKIQLVIPAGAPDPTTGPFPGAYVVLGITAGQPLPDNQPIFQGTGFPAVPGALRLKIVFTDGSTVLVNDNGTLNNGAGYTWTQAKSDNTGKTVERVGLIADNSDAAGFTASISCINYSGTAEFGTC